MISFARIITAACGLMIVLSGSACSTGGGGSGGVSGNDGGSEPVNSQEALDYKKAVVRCYKTGGTRVVKIMGTLKCY